MSTMLRSLMRKSPFVFYGTTIACLGVLGAVVATIIQNVTTGDIADFGLLVHRISMMTMLAGVVVIWMAIFYRRVVPKHACASMKLVVEFGYRQSNERNVYIFRR